MAGEVQSAGPCSILDEKGLETDSTASDFVLQTLPQAVKGGEKHHGRSAHSGSPVGRDWFSAARIGPVAWSLD